jgi:hypothetical protein
MAVQVELTLLKVAAVVVEQLLQVVLEVVHRVEMVVLEQQVQLMEHLQQEVEVVLELILMV